MRALLQPVKVIRPQLHHLPAPGKVRGPVVSPAVRVPHGMGKLVFYVIRIPVEIVLLWSQ